MYFLQLFVLVGLKIELVHKLGPEGNTQGNYDTAAA